MAVLAIILIPEIERRLILRADAADTVTAAVIVTAVAAVTVMGGGTVTVVAVIVTAADVGIVSSGRACRK